MHTEGITGTHKTYPQVWSAYNRAQTTEKDCFLHLLKNLCAGIEDVPQEMGRPRLPLGDAVFCLCYKVYSTLSGRRFSSDLRDAAAKGFISLAPHYNSLFNVLGREDLSPLLKSLIIQTSLPLTAVEEDFAVDSTGFSTSRYSSWTEHKYGKSRRKEWVKVHIACGVKTNIVTAVDILDKTQGDAPILPSLVKTTAENFCLNEVSADKAYGSFRNYDAISETGGTPYIPFKENRKFDHPYVKNPLFYKISPKRVLWEKMYHYFHYRRDEFMAHYHKRSNVETTFSMIKAKFGGSVRSKTDTAMKNEVYIKILCHNICVLVQEMHELGIDPSLQKGPCESNPF